MIRSLTAPLSGVVVLLAGLGFLLAPATPAAAAPPAQGWTTTEAPLPADAGTNPLVYTASTTCPVANGCVMVGWYDDSAGHSWGLIEQQSGTTWTDTEAPQPSNAGTGTKQGFWFGSQNCGFYELCHAVSCPTAGFCVAVGEYRDSGGTTGYSEPVIDTLSGGTWSSVEAPLPANATTDAGPKFPNNWLMSISCASTTSCVAVGQYIDTSGNEQPVIATLSGTTWSAQAAPLPPGAAGTFLGLNSISCPTVSFCVGGGYYQDSTTVTQGLIVTLGSSGWTAQKAPVPSDFGGPLLLTGMTCPSTSLCVAVGLYDDTGGHAWPVLETWNGSAWVAQRAPLPSDADATPGFQQLNAVSCASAVFCVVTGFYLNTAGDEVGLIDTWQNRTWVNTVAPQPANSDSANQQALLYEVSCPTAAFCSTIGTYQATGNVTAGMVDTLSGASWSSSEITVPSNQLSGGYSYARTVGCYSPVACVVGGWYEDSSSTRQGFLDTWTGAQGYWLDASDGGIFTYPNNTFYGSTGALKLNKPMVGMAATPDAQGYWLVASDGGIFNYGDAGFYGSTGSIVLNKPVVGMAATPDGKGYWLVASDGGIFNYGDAGFYGSRGGQPINAPIVGMAATPDGKGYWLVGSDGGIYSYGDATFFGSTGALKLNKPVVGMAATPTGLGYWLVASDGGIFNYGDAGFYGSTGSIVLNKPVVGMAGSPSGKGYWLVASDGGIFNYGDAPFQGSAGALHLNAPVVGMASG